MTTIKELKQICQGHKLSLKRYSWWLRYVSRGISIYITALAIRLRLTPNQVTFFSLLVGLIMSGVLLDGEPWAVFIGALLFQFFYILDSVDGELAKYKTYMEKDKVFHHKLGHTLTGTFYDSFLHYILLPCFFFSTAIGQYRIIGSFYIIIIGFLASISIPFIGLLNDCKSKCMVDALKRHNGLVVKVRALSGPEKGKEEKPSIFNRTFSLLHHTCFAYSIMNMLTFISIPNFFIPPFYMGRIKLNLVVAFLAYYAAVATIVWTMKFAKMILNDEVSKAVIGLFEIIKDD